MTAGNEKRLMVRVHTMKRWRYVSLTEELIFMMSGSSISSRRSNNLDSHISAIPKEGRGMRQSNASSIISQNSSLSIPSKPDNTEMPHTQFLDNFVPSMIQSISLANSSIPAWLVIHLSFDVSFISAIGVYVVWDCLSCGCRCRC